MRRLAVAARQRHQWRRKSCGRVPNAAARGARRVLEDERRRKRQGFRSARACSMSGTGGLERQAGAAVPLPRWRGRWQQPRHARMHPLHNALRCTQRAASGTAKARKDFGRRHAKFAVVPPRFCGCELLLSQCRGVVRISDAGRGGSRRQQKSLHAKWELNQGCSARTALLPFPTRAARSARLPHAGRHQREHATTARGIYRLVCFFHRHFLLARSVVVVAVPSRSWRRRDGLCSGIRKPGSSALRHTHG